MTLPKSSPAADRRRGRPRGRSTAGSTAVRHRRCRPPTSRSPPACVDDTRATLTTRGRDGNRASTPGTVPIARRSCAPSRRRPTCSTTRTTGSAPTARPRGARRGCRRAGRRGSRRTGRSGSRSRRRSGDGAGSRTAEARAGPTVSRRLARLGRSADRAKARCWPPTVCAGGYCDTAGRVSIVHRARDAPWPGIGCRHRSVRSRAERRRAAAIDPTRRHRPEPRVCASDGAARRALAVERSRSAAPGPVAAAPTADTYATSDCPIVTRHQSVAARAWGSSCRRAIAEPAR